MSIENAAARGRAAARIIGGVGFTLLLTFIGLTAVTFVIGRVMPADPVLAIVGDRAPQDVYDLVYQQMGLDRPLYEQYLRYLGQLVRGDLGTSIMTARPVLDDLIRFFPATMELATIATVLGVFLGIPMGVLAAVHQGQWPDHMVRIVGLIGYSMPIFWLGMVALLITIIGLTYASLLEGSVLTETVFSWPGIGQYITTSLFNGDMPAVLGGTIVVGICFVGINMFSDLLYRLVDPRARA